MYATAWSDQHGEVPIVDGIFPLPIANDDSPITDC
jgi:hypothetical protein